MEKSEPSLVPEWLRGSVGGGLSHHFASSQAGKSSLINSRKNSSSSGAGNRHDKNPYSRSFSGSTRNQCNRDFDKSAIVDSWDLDYPGPLTSFSGRCVEKGTLGRSKSMISGKAAEFSQRRAFTDLRNRSYNVHSNGNGVASVDSGSSGNQKMSLERDFPVLEHDGRPITPDIVRVPSPRLSKGVQELSIGTSPLLGREGWTSALAEVPAGAKGSDSIGSLHGQQQPSDSVSDSAPPPSASISRTGSPNHLAEALSQAPVLSQSVQQITLQSQRREELPFLGTKKLIPMTALAPKTMVLNPSDKLKPKTASRSNDGVAGSKNGLQQMSLQLRCGSGLPDCTKSSSGMLLLKPGREKGVSPPLKDVASIVTNGSFTGAPTITSASFKNLNNVKHPLTERKIGAHSLNAVPVVDKRVSLAQLRSRNDFLNLIRKKSTGSTSSVDTGTIVSSSIRHSGESEVTTSGPLRSTKISEENCNGDACHSTNNCSYQSENSVTQYDVIHPEEELELLKRMGWKDDAEDDEGLTEEEINAFVEKYMTSKHAAKLIRGLQIKMTAGPDSRGLCVASASPELSTSST